MLKTRIFTAFILFSAFLSALFLLSGSGWLFFCTLIAGIAAWEWGGLMALSVRWRLLIGAGLVALCLAISAIEPAALGLESGFSESAWRLGRWFYIPATVFWLVVVPLWMKCRWPLPKNPLGLIIGLLVVLPAWLALVQLRAAGALALLAVMTAVWLADIAAYFFGRTLGRHKLAPSISPGKTWEGALGGALAVVVYGFSFATFLPVELRENLPFLGFILVGAASVSVIGDLFESMLKRQAGLKDSSAILPGHGGVLDRIDSLTSTLPLVALAWLSSIH